MRTIKIIMTTALAAAGTLGLATPTIAADSRPSARHLIECAGGMQDLGNGQGGAMCVPENNQFCPGTWTDNNGDGDVAYDYGECYYTGGELNPGGGGSNPTSPPATQPPATQPPATQPPATQPGATNPPAATNPSPTGSAGSAPGNDAAAEVAEAPTTVDVGPVGPPSLAITYAQVECNGMIHVEYDTAANPAPSDEVTHLIVFHAASAPAVYNVVELTGQAPFGSYSFDHLGSVDDTYRLWITVMFDTVNPDVPALTDWADVILTDC